MFHGNSFKCEILIIVNWYFLIPKKKKKWKNKANIEILASFFSFVINFFWKFIYNINKKKALINLYDNLIDNLRIILVKIAR